MIDIIIEGQEIRFYGPPDITADGSVNFVKFKFTFSAEWSGYVKVAQFAQAGATTNVVINHDDTCFMPPEVKSGVMFMSVWGQAPGLAPRGTTNQIRFVISASGVGENPALPLTPDLYSQLLQDIVDHSTIAAESSDAASGFAHEAEGHVEEARRLLDLVDTYYDETKLLRDDTELFSQAAHDSKQVALDKANQAEQARISAVAAKNEAERYYASLIGVELVVDVINGTLNLYSAGDYSPIDIELNDRSLEVWGA